MVTAKDHKSHQSLLHQWHSLTNIMHIADYAVTINCCQEYTSKLRGNRRKGRCHGYFFPLEILEKIFTTLSNVVDYVLISKYCKSLDKVAGYRSFSKNAEGKW